MSITFFLDKDGFNPDRSLDVNITQALGELILENLAGGMYSLPPYSCHGDSTGRVPYDQLPQLLMANSLLMINLDLLTREASTTRGIRGGSGRHGVQVQGMRIHHAAFSHERVTTILVGLQTLIVYAHARQADVVWA